MAPRVSLPPMAWRVVFVQGFGWPTRTYTRRTTRRFDNPEDAARLVRTIRELPTHHELIGVWESTCSWVPSDPALLLELLEHHEAQHLDEGASIHDLDRYPDP